MLRTDTVRAFLVASVASLGTFLSIAPEAVAQETHGALAMNAQLEAIPDLLPDRDVSEPPPAVDPFIWSTVVIPEDNALTPERGRIGPQTLLRHPVVRRRHRRLRNRP